MGRYRGGKFQNLQFNFTLFQTTFGLLFGYILPIYGLLMIFWVKFNIKNVKLSLKCLNLALFGPKMTKNDHF